MPLTNKAKLWVAALRSGDYLQAKGKLKNLDSYCCLGLACELSGTGEWVKDAGGLREGYRVLDNRTGTPLYFDKLWPAEVARQLGVSNSLDLPHYESAMLTSMNDAGVTFPQIADLIEWYYES